MRKIIVVMILVLCIIFVSAFFIIKFALTSPISPFFLAYEDPDHYFTISIPVTWNREQAVGVGTTNIGTVYQRSQRVEVVHFSSLNIGIAIQVVEANPTCADSIPMNKYTTTKLSGLPALYDPSSTTWFLKTTNASYIIIASYPGGGGVFNKPTQNVGGPVGKFIPQFIQDQDKELVTRIINSFHPLKANLFPCY